MDDVGDSPPWRLMRLLDGYITTQLLYVAAKLDIASVLADGPMTASPAGLGVIEASLA